MDFKEGLYEQLITKSLKEHLDNANKNISFHEGLRGANRSWEQEDKFSVLLLNFLNH